MKPRAALTISRVLEESSRHTLCSSSSMVVVAMESGRKETYRETQSNVNGQLSVKFTFTVLILDVYS